MIPYLGDYKAGQTVRYWWGTAGANGASITRAVDGAIRVYKGNNLVERASSIGITDVEDFDGLTGVHLLAIDLAEDTDPNFFAAGNDYSIVLAGATVDGQAINTPLACFSIENRITRSNVIEVSGQLTQSTTAPMAANITQINGQAVSGGAVPATVSGTVSANVTQVNGQTFAGASVPASATVSGTVSANVTQVGGQTLAGGAVPATLVPTGLDAISMADPGGVAAMNTLPRQVNALWRRFFKKVVKNDTAITGYADDGLTVCWTQAYADDGAGHETLEATS